MSKFDKATNTAAPLLSDRTLAQAVNEIATTSIATVQGLPQTDNMLFSIGIRLNDQGAMTIDQKKLGEKVEEDFATVANLFRSHGASDQPGVTFVGSTDETQINSDGFKIDVKQASEKGYYLGTPLPPMITVNETNDTVSIISGGRSSDPLKLRHDMYSPNSLAKQIQNRINDDNVLGRRGIQVREEDGRIKIVSGSFGSRSKIEIEAGKDRDISSLGLTDGESVPGKDVDGTIDGFQATGRGQLLVGTEETPTEGLRVFVNLDEKEILPEQEEARVKLTKGIAVKLGDKLKRMNNPVDGDVKKVTNDITDQIGNYDEQLVRLGERIEDKHRHLQIKFAKLDSTMGRLRSQQNYVSQQLAALSSSPKGGGGNKDN